MDKPCRVCGAAFEPTARNRAKSNWICKECLRKYNAAYLQKRRLAGRPHSGSKMPRAYHAAYERTYKERPGVLRKRADRAKVRRAMEPHKWQARVAVRRAIEAGRLTRIPCEQCGESKVDAHHDDYEKPLAVRWLCRPCHSKHHAKAKP